MYIRATCLHKNSSTGSSSSSQQDSRTNRTHIRPYWRHLLPHIHNLTSTASHLLHHIYYLTSTTSHLLPHIYNLTSTTSHLLHHINYLTSTTSHLLPLASSLPRGSGWYYVCWNKSSSSSSAFSPTTTTCICYYYLCFLIYISKSQKYLPLYLLLLLCTFFCSYYHYLCFLFLVSSTTTCAFGSTFLPPGRAGDDWAPHSHICDKRPLTSPPAPAGYMSRISM